MSESGRNRHVVLRAGEYGGDVESRLTMRTLEVGDSTYVLTLAGELDLAGVPEIDTELQRIGGGQVIVDLLDITFIDAAGLGAIARAAQCGELTIVADARTAQLLASTGIAGRVHVATSLASAVADAVSL